jgi:hypothetical protein
VGEQLAQKTIKAIGDKVNQYYPALAHGKIWHGKKIKGATGSTGTFYKL